MNLAFRLYKEETGAAAVEFGLTAPGFFMLIAGIICCGLLLWTQLALQHGAERAARCASVNSDLCGTVAAIQSYAAHQALGLNPPASTFTVTTPPCGNKVSAAYTFIFITKYFGLPNLAIGAEACFPK
jgi:Flp pilus assembly protein TadG